MKNTLLVVHDASDFWCQCESCLAGVKTEKPSTSEREHPDGDDDKDY